MRILAALTVFTVIAATILVGAGGGGNILHFVQYIPGQDLTVHFLLYGLLGFTTISCVRQSTVDWIARRWRSFFILLLVLVVLEETSQAFISTRNFSLADLGASLTGLAVGCLISDWYCRGGRKMTGSTTN